MKNLLYINTIFISYILIGIKKICLYFLFFIINWIEIIIQINSYIEIKNYYIYLWNFSNKYILILIYLVILIFYIFIKKFSKKIFSLILLHIYLYIIGYLIYFKLYQNLINLFLKILSNYGNILFYFNILDILNLYILFLFIAYIIYHIIYFKKQNVLKESFNNKCKQFIIIAIIYIYYYNFFKFFIIIYFIYYIKYNLYYKLI